MATKTPARASAQQRRRAATGRGTPGSFAPELLDEAPQIALVEPAEDAPHRIDPDTGLPEHSLAHLGIITTRDASGALVARNTRGGSVPCPHCRLPDGSGQDRAKQAVCAPCAGRGFTSDVPFCEREWDCVDVNDQGGHLYLGGHDAQPGGGDCQPDDKFDLVVSLYRRSGHDPADGVPHLKHQMIDGPLDPADHPKLDLLADAVVEAYGRGEKVLVRCQAGMNRSGLVMGLAMVKMGWDADEAIDRMRAERGPWVLFNDEFVEHVRAEAARLRGETPLPAAPVEHSVEHLREHLGEAPHTRTA